MDDAFHDSVGSVDWAVAPFRGEESAGAGGGVVVVKLHTLDHALVPTELVAFTRQ